ncbi:uncharacterized protein BCR38DRAFT_357152 [Pseudomassariella vexata]|uniref:Uncharacterized protein n=1 Tax=Pseudomassariella vexata TaxID=1141098 RepID=A0A1Y2D776_9PEZI|nr:uncharacterized protein BCR38DRAFT_357152 [Pseudomassariella vexata]ORY55132.1 hypothetical protein BCR38DRAFT_357152 [Pseudomassariella vexata]
MSASCPDTLANYIFRIAAEPFTPKPLIADILRTEYCPLGSIFLVEGIDIIHTSRSKRWRVVRLLLGDGQLCIQAVLSAEMHRYVDAGDVAVGSYIKLGVFRVGTNRQDARSTIAGNLREKAALKQGRPMVYLVVEDLVMVGWDNRLLEEPNEADVTSATEGTLIQKDERRKGAKDAEGQPSGAPNLATPAKVHSVTMAPASSIPKTTADADLLKEVVKADDDFESNTITYHKTTQKQLEITAQTSGYVASLDSRHLPWSSTDPTKPLKLTPLRNIPHLPYKQNWSVNLLAIVSAISDLEPSALPPFSQRQARIADPSTSKHVHLTVFLDAEEFHPEVGSVVLLLGVKNHRFDGGSVKKYVSDRPKDGSSWWYENPTQFLWCDVEGLRRWWDEVGTERHT